MTMQLYWDQLEDHDAITRRWTGTTALLNEEAGGLCGQVDIDRDVTWMGEEPMVTLTWVDATDSGTEVFYGRADQAEVWWAELERTLEADDDRLSGTLDMLQRGRDRVSRLDEAGRGDRWRGWQIVRGLEVWGRGRG